MTIITKPLSSEKKGDKLVIPLVENDQLASAPLSDDIGGQHNPNVVILNARARRVSITTNLCLLLTSLIVVSIGITGGKYLYDQYISAQMRRFHGYAQIPIPSEDAQRLYLNERNLVPNSILLKALSGESVEDDDNNNNNINNNNDNFDAIMKNYFNEEFELDMDKEKYEKIDVPDFWDGRKGRFIHDFNTNITGIIDIKANRCFIMPLNRSTVLPPKSLFDLIQKMWGGYYKVDTRIVRNTMRVVIPPLQGEELEGIGAYISQECKNRPVYKLERIVGGVVKRSADLHESVKFTQFSGNKITEFDIVNFDELKIFEEGGKSH